jgi:hypothetical protein
MTELPSCLTVHWSAQVMMPPLMHTQVAMGKDPYNHTNDHLTIN